MNHHGSILQRSIFQRNPDAEGMTRAKRPVGRVEMPGRGISVGLLDQGLIMPDAETRPRGCRRVR